MTYDLTILCIMRNSISYFDRCITQINSAFEHFAHSHLIVCEGNSTDGTKERLAQIAVEGDTEVRGDVTVVELDLTFPNVPGNVNHPTRWRTLEVSWNECLKRLEPTMLAVCVESDLIWSWPTLEKMFLHLEAGRGDVIVPMLMRETVVMGKYYYDVHANIADGINFQNYPPYHPALKDDEQFLTLDNGGGMLVTRGETLAKAVWAKECVLQWPVGTRVVMDTKAEIWHP